MKKRLMSTIMALLMVCSLVMYMPNKFIMDLPASAITQSEFDSKLSSLRSTYPNYSTWNSSFDGGTQCFGFARLIAYNVFGSHVSSWTQVYSIGGVKAGDVVQYGNTSGSGHTIFVTSVSGDTITFVDCNGNGNYSGGSKVRSCGIKWDNTISKSAMMFGKYSFVYLYSSPWNIIRIDTPVDNSYEVPCIRMASKKHDIYDVYGNPEYNSNGVRRYIAQNDECTIHEVYGSGYVKVTYPVGNGTHTAYAKNDGWSLSKTNVNHDPIGVVDRIEGREGKVNVYGWAFDPDNSSKSLNIHVYIGGPAGSGAGCYDGIIANAESSDVNNAYGISGNHRFNAWIETTARGNQPIYVYAINSEGGNNPCIGSGTVNISEATKPVISNVKISNVSTSGYTVTCTVTDNVGIDRVQFPTWTLANDQDDIQPSWGDNPSARGTINGNTVTYRVNRSDHKNEFGTYRTHIYAYDTSGNSRCVACDDVNVGVGKEMTSGAGQTIPDGDYIIVSELGQNLYLDIPGVEHPAANEIDVTVCDGSVLPGKSDLFDTWTVKFLGDGFYKITQNGTDMSLDVKNDSLLPGTEIMTHPWHGKSNQRWSIAETNHGYTIQAKSSGWYLDVRGANTATGTKVQMWESNGNKAQHWCFIPVASDERPIPDGEYYIKSALGNVYLDVDGDFNYKNCSNVQIWNGKTDSFSVKYVSDGYYKIYETTSGLALDVYHPNKDYDFKCPGNLELYDGTNMNKRCQLWRIIDEGNNKYRLINKMNGYSLDVNGGISDNGTNVQVNAYNKTNAQKWSFEKVHKHTATATAAKAATCTENGNTAYWYCSGCKKYFSDSACTKEITLASTVVKATGHKFGSWTTAKAATCTTDGQQTRKCSTCGMTETKVIAAIGHKYVDTVVEPTCTEKGYTKHVCSNCGKTYTDSEVLANGHSYTVETIAPTETTAGYDKHTCDVCGDFYIDNVVPPIPPAPVIEIPTVSYVPGDSAVKLTWTTVSGAEKYAVCGYISGKWQKLAEGNGTSYTLKDLKAGKEYKVAVIAMINGKWNYDYSNAIVVTPKAEEISKYPKVTDIEYSEQYHQFRLTWNAVDCATEYGIAVKLGGKWKIQAYTNKTNFTSPKLREGSTVEMVVCAKVNGEWDISSINSRAFKVTVK